MRPLRPEAQAALASGAVALVVLVEMHFQSGTVRLATSRRRILDFDSPPNEYLAAGLIGKIEAIQDQVRDISTVKLSISGVDSAIIAIALAEQVRGRVVKLHVAILDAKTQETLDIVQIFSGQMSSMQIQQQSETASVALTCEHRGVLFARPKPLRYTDAEQRRMFPDDHCLEFIASQAQKLDVWPAASWGKQ